MRWQKKGLYNKSIIWMVTNCQAEIFAPEVWRNAHVEWPEYVLWYLRQAQYQALLFNTFINNPEKGWTMSWQSLLMTPNYSGQSALKLAVKSCRDSCDTGRGVKSADELSHETNSSAWRATAELGIRRLRAPWTARREYVGMVIHHFTQSSGWDAWWKG